MFVRPSAQGCLIVFKVGDDVVHILYKNSDVQKIKTVEQKRIEVFHRSMQFSYWVYKFNFRLATPEEVEVGYRLN